MSRPTLRRVYEAWAVTRCSRSKLSAHSGRRFGGRRSPRVGSGRHFAGSWPARSPRCPGARSALLCAAALSRPPSSWSSGRRRRRAWRQPRKQIWFEPRAGSLSSRTRCTPPRSTRPRRERRRCALHERLARLVSDPRSGRASSPWQRQGLMRTSPVRSSRAPPWRARAAPGSRPRNCSNGRGA